MHPRTEHTCQLASLKVTAEWRLEIFIEDVSVMSPYPPIYPLSFSFASYFMSSLINLSSRILWPFPAGHGHGYIPRSLRTPSSPPCALPTPSTDPRSTMSPSSTPGSSLSSSLPLRTGILTATVLAEKRTSWSSLFDVEDDLQAPSPEELKYDASTSTLASRRRSKGYAQRACSRTGWSSLTTATARYSSFPQLHSSTITHHSRTRHRLGC